MVSLGVGADLDGDEGSVGVFKAGINFVEALRLELQEYSLLLPAHKVLQRLEHGEVNLKLAARELRVDLLVEHVAEPTGNRNGDARVAHGKILGGSVPWRRWAARVEDQRAFGFCFFVERV